MSFERAGNIVNVHGVEIEVDIRGSGAPVFILPSEEDWESDHPLVEELAKTRKVVIAYPPGFGRSARPDWITHPDHLPLRLRGLYCSVQKDGEMRLGDTLHRM